MCNAVRGAQLAIKVAEEPAPAGKRGQGSAITWHKGMEATIAVSILPKSP